MQCLKSTTTSVGKEPHRAPLHHQHDPLLTYKIDDQTPLYVSLSKAPAESFFSLAITNIRFDQVASWEGAAARVISGITLYASQILPKPVSSSASKLSKFTPSLENISIPWRRCCVQGFSPFLFDLGFADDLKVLYYLNLCDMQYFPKFSF